MKRTLLLLICVTGCIAAFAQSDKEKAAYAQKALELQKEIWGNPVPEFKETKVPPNFNKESAVVLARSFSLSRASGGRLKFVLAFSVTTRTSKFSIFHERVKINDKTALESFSTLEYQKKLDKTTSMLFTKFIDLNNTFVGAKVIKPNGKEIIVNTSEEVLTKNETKDQKGKLAISELQVGDILDYYVSREYLADKVQGNSYKENDDLFFLVDEYPVLYYSIDFQFNKKINVKTIYANGASHFVESKNEEGDQLYSLKLHNIPKYQSQLWTSSFRQYPYIEIGSSFDEGIDKIIKVKHYEGKTAMLQAQKYIFESAFIESEYNYPELENKLKDYFKDKKSLKNAPLDSSVKILYAKWKFYIFCTYFEKDLEDFSSLRYRRALSQFNTVNMSMILNDLKIDFDVLLVASRNTNDLDGVFNNDDFDALIRVNYGAKPMYICFDDVVNHFDEIPERFQGEKVIVLHPKKESTHQYSFTEREGVLPVTASAENNIDEHLEVSMADNGMQKLKIDRLVKQKGSMRHDDQKTLLSMEDIDG